MSEAENSQETNGTANGDVPEIELIIKEEYICEDKEPHNTCKAYSAAADSGEVEEKENVPCSCGALANRQSETAASGLTLTHRICDGMHNFCFEFTKAAQEVHHTALERLSDSKDTANTTLPAQTVLKTGSSCSENSALDFASVVAEACEGLFDEIENDISEILQQSESAQRATARARRDRSSYDPEAMKLAVDAVLKDGMTLSQAAKKYNVVRSTVWKHATRNPDHKSRDSNSEQRELINSKLSAGVSISEISRTLHVPKSTVHLAKTRLKERGLLPPVWVRIGSKDIVDHAGVQKRLQQAYRGHVVNGMSVRFAADFFSVPLSTLWRYIKRQQTAAGGATEKVPQKKKKAESRVKVGSDDGVDVDVDAKVVQDMSTQTSATDYMCITSGAEADAQAADETKFEQLLINELFK